MADENNEDDSWLYGSSNNENQSEDPNNDTEEPNDENESNVDGKNAESNVRFEYIYIYFFFTRTFNGNRLNLYCFISE